MLLKNLRVAEGLANGSRLVYMGTVPGQGGKLAFRALKPPHRQYQLKKCMTTFKLPNGQRMHRLQYPLRLAYCTTVHKSQGQTCQRLGLYMARGTTLFAEGMCYTGLSRIQHPDHLRVYAPGREQQQVFSCGCNFALKLEFKYLLLRNRSSPFGSAQIDAKGKFAYNGQR